MPLPVSHSLAAVAIATAVDRDGRRIPARRIAAAVVLASAADLDFVPGLLTGEPNRFHQSATHSLGVALAVGVLAGVWALLARRSWPVLIPGASPPAGPAATTRGGPWGRAFGTAAIVAALWGSHVLLDACTDDPTAPIGVPMFWPLSDAAVHFGGFFYRAEKLTGQVGALDWLTSLVNPHNLYAALVELVAVGPLAALTWWWRAPTSRPPVAGASREGR